MIRAAAERNWATARGAIEGLFSANVVVLLNLIFLAHQTLLSLDAMIRALVRRLVTGQRLLEWETAAEAELGTRRTPLERYLNWRRHWRCWHSEFCSGSLVPARFPRPCPS